jgi:hypothetical protein
MSCTLRNIGGVIRPARELKQSFSLSLFSFLFSFSLCLPPEFEARSRGRSLLIFISFFLPFKAQN